MAQNKILEAKQTLSILIENLKSVTNDELVKLGQALYPNILGRQSLENEAFVIADNLWQIYSVRGDLTNAVMYYSKINMDSENM